MPETRPGDSPWPNSHPVREIATPNKATQRCGGLLVAASAIIDALSQSMKNNQVKKNLEIDLGQLEIFSLKDLQVATDNFSNKNILGGGAFGTVYKGRLSDGSFVAVKRLNSKLVQGELEFQTAVEMISRAIHRNLIRLHGFCMTPEERILVYPFMPNGSVASCMRKRSKSQPPLSWEIRKRIAFGAARGLAYLHEDCNPKIIHRDVKAANILLDEEFEAVVGDFWLSKRMHFDDIHGTAIIIAATAAYMGPEYIYSGKCSEKTDIYAYGIVLLELISGKRAIDFYRLYTDEDVMLLDWVTKLVKEKKFDTVVDVDLHGNFYVDEVEELLRIALLCTRSSPMERPKMSEIVRLLSHLLNKR